MPSRTKVAKQIHDEFASFGFSVKAGNSLIEKSFCFDKLSRFLLCCSEQQVLVFHVGTGNCVQRLQHNAQVLGVTLSAQNCQQAVTCTSTGEISYWDFEDGICLKNYQLACTSVFAFFDVTKPFPWWLYVGKSSANADLRLFLARVKADGSIPEVEHAVGLPSNANHVAINKEGRFVAFVCDNKLIIKRIQKEANLKVMKHYTENHIKFTCVACHPSENDLSFTTVVTGDSLGRLIVWCGILTRVPSQTILHWHTMPVQHLAYSPEGSLLFSGAEERVLVKWSVAQRGDAGRTFLPRLAAGIVRICCAPSGDHIAVATMDNAILLLSSQLKTVQTISGFIRGAFKPPPELKQPLLPAGLTLCNLLSGRDDIKEHGSGCVIANGRPGELQFYSIDDDRQLLNLDVVAQNLPPPERNKILPYTEVVSVASSANWLATLELNPDASLDFSKEICLKFWKFYSDGAKKFVVISRFEFPHGDFDVSSVCFSPANTRKASSVVDETVSEGPTLTFNQSLVTTGLDGKFRVWSLEVQANADDPTKPAKEFWFNERYGEYRDLPAHACAFSTDGGSVLAVGFQSNLTLWRFETNQFLTAVPLEHSTHLEDNHIRHIEFGLNTYQRKDGRYVVCTTCTDLYVVDVIRLMVTWSVKLNVTAMCKDLVTGHFAVLDDHGFLSIYQPSSAAALIHRAISLDTTGATNEADSCALTTPKDAKKRVCAAAIFVNNGKSKNKISPLYFVDSEQRLIRFGEPELQPLKDLFKLETEESKLASVLQSTRIDASEEEKQMEVDGEKPTWQFDYKYNIKLMQGSAHSLPPIEMLASAFIQSCLKPKEPEGLELPTFPSQKRTEGQPPAEHSRLIENSTQARSAVIPDIVPHIDAKHFQFLASVFKSA